MYIVHKIVRTANTPLAPPNELETSITQALNDLEASAPNLKAELCPLQISVAIIVFVPIPLLKVFRKVQPQCVNVSDATSFS